MVAFLELLVDSWERKDPVVELALIPLLSAFLHLGHVEKVLAFSGVNFGIRFPLPAPVVDLWSFTSTPTPGTGGGLILFGPLWTLPVLVLVESALLAGYLGSLDEGFRTGRYDFVANVRTYFVDFLVYSVLATVVVLPFAGSLFAGALPPVVAVPLFVVVILLGYLFYAAPFLVVVRDVSIVAALRISFDLATGGDEYAEYFFKHAAVGAALSILVTPFATSVGALGLVVGALVTAPVGLVFSLATLRFVRTYSGTTGRSGIQSRSSTLGAE